MGGMQIVRDFSFFVRQHQNQVQAYLRKLLRDHHQAEDLRQEVFLRALRVHLRTGGHLPALARPWLLRIAKHLVIDQARKPGSGLLAGHAAGEVAESPREFLDAEDIVVAGEPRCRREAAAAVSEKVAELHPSHRQVLALRYEKKYPCWEIAMRSGISLTSAKVRLHRGRQRLRRVLEESLCRENTNQQGGRE